MEVSPRISTKRIDGVRIPGSELSDATTTTTAFDSSFEWDAANRLTAITYSGTSNRTEFSYDGLSHWKKIVEKTGSTVTSTKQFLWVSNRLAEERDGSNNVTRRYFAQGEQHPGGADVGLYYYSRDHLGSIRELTDAVGTLRARYDYDPFGNTTKLTGDLTLDFGYTGHYRHAASNLYLAPYRAYDPTIGRWLNQDPIGERGGLNLYGYVGNDAINQIDPDGLIRWPGDPVVWIYTILSLWNNVVHPVEPPADIPPTRERTRQEQQDREKRGKPDNCPPNTGGSPSPSPSPSVKPDRPPTPDQTPNRPHGNPFIPGSPLNPVWQPFP